MPESQLAQYRPMVHADVPVTRYIFQEAIQELERSVGREASSMETRRYPHFAHMLDTDPQGSWIAEIGGMPVGFAQGFTRGEIWFLAQLFVQPSVHAKGVGAGLLRRAVDAGRAAGARILSVVASPSPSAHRLYMGAGMFAVGVGYNMSGPADALLSLPEPAANRKRIVDCSGWQDKVAALDARIYGAERRADRAFYFSGAVAAGGDYTSYGLTDGGDLLGYGFTSEFGRIGPLAALAPEDQLPLMRMGTEWLVDHEIGRATAFCVSTNTVAMRALLERGWRMDSWNYFLTSEQFGQFDRYLPSGGLLL